MDGKLTEKVSSTFLSIAPVASKVGIMLPKLGERTYQVECSESISNKKTYNTRTLFPHRIMHAKIIVRTIPVLYSVTVLHPVRFQLPSINWMRYIFPGNRLIVTKWVTRPIRKANENASFRWSLRSVLLAKKLPMVLFT